MRYLYSPAKTKAFDRAEEIRMDTNQEYNEIDAFTEEL